MRQTISSRERELGRQLRELFFHGPRLLRWGVTLAEAAKMAGAPVRHGRQLDLWRLGTSLGPVEVCSTHVRGPRPTGPVTQASYALGPDLAVHTPEGLARVRSLLETILDPGEHRERVHPGF